MVSKRFSIFEIIAVLLLFCIGIICFLPFVHLLAKSFSNSNAVISGKVVFLPVGFQLDVYRLVLNNRLFWQSFRNSIFITVVGTALAMATTILAAYPLSKKNFIGQKFVLLLYVFSMLFYGGTIPIYILMQTLGLLNNVWSIIIPFLVVPFNLFIIKSGFEAIPDSIEESAKLDGANNYTILTRFYLPLSLPTIATIALFYAVNYWNEYYHAMIFITRQEAKPLQLYLYEMITSAAESSSELGFEASLNLSSSGMQAGAIVVGMLPVVLLYLGAQKYFKKGLTIGSVKG
jgi:putative aldouronate transport system permease protein